jgi:hypothetical protein
MTILAVSPKCELPGMPPKTQAARDCGRGDEARQDSSRDAGRLLYCQQPLQTQAFGALWWPCGGPAHSCGQTLGGGQAGGGGALPGPNCCSSQNQTHPRLLRSTVPVEGPSLGRTPPSVWSPASQVGWGRGFDLGFHWDRCDDSELFCLG